MMHASSEFSVIDGLEWFQGFGSDCTDTGVHIYVERKECKDQNILEVLTEDTIPHTFDDQEQNQSDILKPKMNKGSVEITYPGFSVTTTGYCTFNSKPSV